MSFLREQNNEKIYHEIEVDHVVCKKQKPITYGYNQFLCIQISTAKSATSKC